MRSNRARKRARRMVVSVVLWVMVLMSASAFAALLSTTASDLSVFKPTKLPGCRTPEIQTLIAAEDSYVDQNEPTATNGSDVNLYVMSKTTLLGLGDDDNRRTYVRFDLPALSGGCVVTAATLRLHAKSAAADRTIQAFRANGVWAEGTVSWNNQPGSTGTAATSASGTGWQSWAVAAQVQQMYAGPNDGFMLQDATENDGTTGSSQNYHSSNDTLNRPELVVTIGNP